MNNLALFWLILTIACIATHAFFSMLEMASVSFNKARLHYYVSLQEKRAIWLDFLLKNPSYLFGTTLIGVNVALQVGSECSRQFYEACNLPANLAPITQVVIVLIFAELGPMLTAYRHPEHTVRIGIPILYAISKIIHPIILVISLISKLVNFLIGERQTGTETLFGRDELQKVFEGYENINITANKVEELNYITTNIFNLRKQVAKHVMFPVQNARAVQSSSTVRHVRNMFAKTDLSFLPIYHKSPNHIIGIIRPHQLIRAEEHRCVRDYAKPPWFISEQTPLLQILQHFRYNKQNVAIVLDKHGLASGILSLEDLLDQVLGHGFVITKQEEELHPEQVIEKTIPADMSIEEFNKQFGTNIDAEEAENFGKLIEQKLGHIPKKDDSIRIDEFEIRVEEASLLGAKTIFIKTRGQT